MNDICMFSVTFHDAETPTVIDLDTLMDTCVIRVRLTDRHEEEMMVTCVLFHSQQTLNSVKAGQQGGVTHSAHSWGQVFPAQLEDRQWAVAGHIPDVGAEALGSCSQNKEQRERLWFGLTSWFG